MGVSLQKGQKVDLTKGNPGLSKIVVGLGWDTNKYDGGQSFDLDASAFLLSATGKVSSDLDFIFYNNLTGGNNSVIHTGDNRTGEGDGDDEQIKVDLNEIPTSIAKVTFTCTIHDAEARKQTFGQVSNAFIRVVDELTNQEILRYDLGEDFSIETALVFGEIYRNGSEWKFNAIGQGYQGGLKSLCNSFGIEA